MGVGEYQVNPTRPDTVFSVSETLLCLRHEHNTLERAGHFVIHNENLQSDTHILLCGGSGKLNHVSLILTMYIQSEPFKEIIVEQGQNVL